METDPWSADTRIRQHTLFTTLAVEEAIQIQNNITLIFITWSPKMIISMLLLIGVYIKHDIIIHHYRYKS